VDLRNAEALARTLMDDHGLHDVEFRWSRARRTFGVARVRTERMGRRVISETPLSITLSSVLTEMNDESQVRDTILHEIAHCLAGHQAGHGWAWKLKCREVGADPTRCCGDDVVAPPHRWVGSCPNGHSTCAERLTAKRKKSACAKCCRGRFSEEFIWQWSRQDDRQDAELVAA
jgi:predicted SprT family Zn-dependent metalloprotease